MRLASCLVGLCVLCGCGPASPGPVDAFVPPLPERDAGPALCPTEATDASVPWTDQDVCAEGIVPMGIGLRWARNAYRLGGVALGLDLGAAHDPVGCPPGAILRGADLETRIAAAAVASTPEGALALFDYQVVGAVDPGGAAPDAGTGAPRTARGLATIELPNGAVEGDGIGLVDLWAARIDGTPEAAVAIEGIELVTDLPQSSGYPSAWSPDRGYASRGLGVAITDVSRADPTTLRVTVHARFEHGALGEPALYPGHDEAIAVARTRVIVRLVAVASDVLPVQGAVFYRLGGQRSDPLAYGAPCHAAPSEMALSIGGAAGLAHAAVGLRSFDLALWPDEPGVGDLVHELSIRVRDLAYDPVSGRATMQVDGYASNEGPFPRRGMVAQVSAEVVLAQWASGGDVGVVSVLAPIGVGPTTTPLPLR